MKYWLLKAESDTETIYIPKAWPGETPQEAFERFLNAYPDMRARNFKLVDWIEVRR